MFEKMPESEGNTVGYKAIGKLTDEDYKAIVPELDALVEEHDSISVLFDIESFEGWSLKASFDDLRFVMKHHSDVKKLAIVGDRKWEEEMAKCSKFFISAEIKTFETGEMSQAWEWLKE
ncbi:STAS/SEC14 domain-containing protein [Patescibacteria group bacterium]|nr:STAS/SEC14 domain-containing protein [Patescibacteria group bacterium]